MHSDLLKEVRSRIPMFNDQNLLESIAEHGRMVQIKQDTVIIDYGQYIHAIPIILDGIIKVSRMGDDGSDFLLYYLKGGNTCPSSFSCCLIEKPSEIRATVIEDASILMIPIKMVDEWIRDYPSWKNFIMQSFTFRFQELLSMIDDVAFNNVDTRLLKYLSKKVELTGKNQFNLTHKEIANDLNTSREAISRLLKKIEKLGYVTLSRNKITVHSFPNL